jgi:hypothetical protein
MMKNNKALTSAQGVILLIIIVVAAVIVGAVALSGAPQEVTNTDIKVYIDTVEQQVNYTAPQTLNWESITAPNTYTKNFTVTNTGTQNYTIILLTTEPYGTKESWEYNNTNLTPNTYASTNLVYTLTQGAVTGSTTWRLIATNMTMPTATATPNPSATPTPNTLQFTINADNNVQEIAVSRNNAAPFVVDAFPSTYYVTVGDNLKFTPTFIDGYTLKGWEFGDGSFPLTTPTLTLNNIAGNFTVTLSSKIAPEPTPTD